MYFVHDIKKLCRSRIEIVMLSALLLVCVIDPISVYWQAAKYPGFFEQIGKNPFQYWLLMNSAGWGNQVYNTLFWVFPVLSTGLVYYYERNSSMSKSLIVRDSRRGYFSANLTSCFLFTFLSFSAVLLINIAVTYIAFPSDAPLTGQYQYLVPTEGGFAAAIYGSSPLLMAVIYSLLNSLTIAVFSVISLSLHMLVGFKNKYIAIVGPIVLYYAINFLMDSVPGLHTHNIRLIIQPRAASGMSDIITFVDLAATLLAWITAGLVLSVAAICNKKDII